MIILVTGGIKSGKSDFALNLAEKTGKKGTLYFLATALPLDSELKEKIKEHRKKRKKIWETIEEPENIDKVFQNLPAKSTVIVDCLTLWLGNIISNRGIGSLSFGKIEKKIKKVVSLIRKRKLTAIFVTNEVGWGIIPENKTSRIFEEYLGKLNQMLAKHADEVYLMVAGINIKIKGVVMSMRDTKND